MALALRPGGSTDDSNVPVSAILLVRIPVKDALLLFVVFSESARAFSTQHPTITYTTTVQYVIKVGEVCRVSDKNPRHELGGDGMRNPLIESCSGPPRTAGRK